MKLAKAAAQQLKGVVIEYDVLCSTVLGKSSLKQVEKDHRQAAPENDGQQVGQRYDSSLFDATSVRSMLVREVRGLLKYLNEDSTGKPWMIKERVQSVLQGFPSQIRERITGVESENQDGEDQTKGKNDLEKHLQSTFEELAHVKQQKNDKRLKLDEWNKEGFGIQSDSQVNSLQEKYLDKISKLKEKKIRERSTMELEKVVEATTSAGLSTWVVNDGANEVLSYSDLRGLFKVAIPPRNPLQDEEYSLFMKEMVGQFDMFLPKNEQQKFPNPAPICYICEKLALKPSDFLVLARYASTIKAAKDAGTHVCHYMPGDKAIPNHMAHYHLTYLRQYQHLIETFNGVSYRDKIAVGSIDF